MILRLKTPSSPVKLWIGALACFLLMPMIVYALDDTNQVAQVENKLELDLKIAQAAFEVAPDREDSYIWLGRRYGYLGRYEEAIEVFTEGLKKFPNSYRLLRFRGRHLARNRQFERAIADYQLGLQKMEGHADSFEPNGIINDIELPTSTYRQNLHYYLGQTSFAVGDYAQMFDELEKSNQTLIELPFDDHRIAVIYWQYIALKKLNKHQQAEALVATLPQPVRILENQAYYDALLVLTDPTNKLSPADNNKLATFALAMRLQFNGDRSGAREILLKLADQSTGGFWPAEVELVQSRRLML